ncbi:GGDEF domain-containing protein [Actinoplanes palleronii]|uniref:GGDEF domain-containing protein n=1 Tax=Actinoplanes palleronii TaxID=113570 RepID=A0ABQ4BB14_9ACTN|nr:GGDEF domain-containing protein [Actinoplanes palleronii]GIE67891.1 hypothetical protein Apa02nite_039990 [Actinoplanes palleronii]
MQFRTPRLALAGYALAAVCFVLHAVGVGTLVTLPLAVALTTLVVVHQIIGLRDNQRLLQQVDVGMIALRQAMVREHVLSDLGTAMLGSTEVAEVHRLAADAAVALLDGCANPRVVIRDPDGTVVHTTGPDLPESRPPAVLALLSGDRAFGSIGVTTDDELPDELVKSLETLRTQVSLALAGVALTAELTRRAMYDMLTELGNRALLRDRLTGALARSRRTQRPVGVLLLDLNGFKAVNDTFGHDAGDTLLKEVADRLRTCVRTEDTVARLGGDEFVVVTEDLREPGDVLVIAERIIEALNEPVTVRGNTLRTPASIGITLSVPGSGTDDVLREADTAMYVAKRQGGGRYHVHALAEIS